MRLGSTVVRSLREGALWVFGALALIVFAALVTYDRNDPSFATTGEPGPISNVIGPFGAHLAGLLILLFGAAAFLFPVMIGVTGWLLFQDRSRGDAPSRATLAFRAAGFLLTLITTCGLASLHFTIASYSSSAGGVLGAFTAQGLEAGLAGVSLFAGLSWLEVMDRTGRVTLSALDWLSTKLTSAREIKAGREVKEARSEVLREEQRRVATRVPPKI
jgi:S-DNA-T family DNA segregation ATPase FtsK/SpoIIIE